MRRRTVKETVAKTSPAAGVLGTEGNSTTITPTNPIVAKAAAEFAASLYSMINDNNSIIAAKQAEIDNAPKPTAQREQLAQLQQQAKLASIREDCGAYRNINKLLADLPTLQGNHLTTLADCHHDQTVSHKQESFKTAVTGEVNEFFKALREAQEQRRVIEYLTKSYLSFIKPSAAAPAAAEAAAGLAASGVFEAGALEAGTDATDRAEQQARLAKNQARLDLRRKWLGLKERKTGTSSSKYSEAEGLKLYSNWMGRIENKLNTALSGVEARLGRLDIHGVASNGAVNKKGHAKLAEHIKSIKKKVATLRGRPGPQDVAELRPDAVGSEAEGGESKDSPLSAERIQAIAVVAQQEAERVQHTTTNIEKLGELLKAAEGLQASYIQMKTKQEQIEHIYHTHAGIDASRRDNVLNELRNDQARDGKASAEAIITKKIVARTKIFLCVKELERIDKVTHDVTKLPSADKLSNSDLKQALIQRGIGSLQNMLPGDDFSGFSIPEVAEHLGLEPDEVTEMWTEAMQLDNAEFTEQYCVKLDSRLKSKAREKGLIIDATQLTVLLTGEEIQKYNPLLSAKEAMMTAQAALPVAGGMGAGSGWVASPVFGHLDEAEAAAAAEDPSLTDYNLQSVLQELLDKLYSLSTHSATFPALFAEQIRSEMKGVPSYSTADDVVSIIYNAFAPPKLHGFSAKLSEASIDEGDIKTILEIVALANALRTLNAKNIAENSKRSNQSNLTLDQLKFAGFEKPASKDAAEGAAAGDGGEDETKSNARSRSVQGLIRALGIMKDDLAVSVADYNTRLAEEQAQTEVPASAAADQGRKIGPLKGNVRLQLSVGNGSDLGSGPDSDSEGWWEDEFFTADPAATQSDSLPRALPKEAMSAAGTLSGAHGEAAAAAFVAQAAAHSSQLSARVMPQGVGVAPPKGSAAETHVDAHRETDAAPLQPVTHEELEAASESIERTLRGRIVTPRPLVGVTVGAGRHPVPLPAAPPQASTAAPAAAAAGLVAVQPEALAGRDGSAAANTGPSHGLNLF